jgi:hypothetical protein
MLPTRALLMLLLLLLLHAPRSPCLRLLYLAPSLKAGLQPSMGSEGIAGSCPAPSSHLDAELPYFSGKSIRTHPNLASLQAVSRAGSAYGGPSSATSMLAAETPFTQGDGLFHASSPLTTPRSPLFDMNATAMAGSNGMLDVQGTSNMPAKVGVVGWSSVFLACEHGTITLHCAWGA